MLFSELLNAMRINIPLSTKDFGMEIEVEGENLAPIQNLYWKSTRDGSLRGESYEYISNGPQSLSNFNKAFKSLMDHFEMNQSRPKMSFRTSVHVHMNVTNLTLSQIQAFAYLYMLFEEDLLHYSGESRHGNRFCLSIRDAEGIVEVCKNVLESSGFGLTNVREDAIRYSSINFASLVKFGTLEFRSMRGTLEKEVLETWLYLLASLRSAAQRFNNPRNVFNYIMQNSFEDFVKEVFKDDLYDGIRRPDSEHDFNYNRSILIEIPFVFKEPNFQNNPRFKQRVEQEKPIARIPRADIRWDVLPPQPVGQFVVNRVGVPPDVIPEYGVDF